MVAVVGLSALLRRGWRAALFHTAPLGLVYVVWWLAFDAQAPDVFARAGIVAAFGGIASGVVAIGGAARRASFKSQATTYGSARWADHADVRTAGMLLFDPTNPLSARFNPLLEVRKGTQEVRDVQNIADILVDPEGAKERRDHWEKTAHALLTGAILHVLSMAAQAALALRWPVPLDAALLLTTARRGS